MFTKEQILEASSQVRSGADYPALVQHFKRLGIQKYEHDVANGFNTYYGENDHSIKTEPAPVLISVSEVSSAEKLKYALQIHQAGKTDYPAFCRHAGEAGVEKWVSDLIKMTVCYLDKSGRTLVEEVIPSP